MINLVRLLWRVRRGQRVWLWWSCEAGWSVL